MKVQLAPFVWLDILILLVLRVIPLITNQEAVLAYHAQTSMLNAKHAILFQIAHSAH